MLTHRNLIANLAQIDAIEAPDLQAFLAVLPFFHIDGMVVIMNFGLMRGATLVTLPRFDLETVLRLLQQWPISLVPSRGVHRSDPEVGLRQDPAPGAGGR